MRRGDKREERVTEQWSHFGSTFETGEKTLRKERDMSSQSTIYIGHYV